MKGIRLQLFFGQAVHTQTIFYLAWTESEMWAVTVMGSPKRRLGLVSRQSWLLRQY